MQVGRAKILHRPALAVVLALAAGIAINSFTQLPVTLWLGVFVLGLVLALLRRGSISPIGLLLSVMAVGGLRYAMVSPDRMEISLAGLPSETAVRIQGTIACEIEIIESEHGPRIPSWMEVDRSTFTLIDPVISSASFPVPLDTKIRVDVDGHLVHADIGDRIEVLGELRLPGPLRNPGGFDFAESLHRQGIGCMLSVNHPQAVSILAKQSSPWWWIPKRRAEVRRECNWIFSQNLKGDARTVAMSMLLGDRSRMNDDLRDRFVQSGTMHLLAISGLHVGILAGLLLVICRLFGMSSRWTAFLVIGVITAYALLTNHRPPVLRATTLATITLWGYATFKRTDGLNTLAACGGLLLLWNPNDLFDVGAQLSFLAVGAILWASEFVMRRPDPAQEALRGERSALFEMLTVFGGWLGKGYIITGAIWLATLPLTMATFHLVAPIGFLLNVLLIPYVAAVLSLGYVFLLGSLLVPVTAGVLVLPFRWSLNGMLWVVDSAQALPGSHFSIPDIPGWWVAMFYAVLFLILILQGTKQIPAYRNQNLKVPVAYSVVGSFLALWIIVGLLMGTVRPDDQDEFRCTFLSVGHGLATVIEYPDGQTLLYDTGNFGDGKRSAHAVERYLWSRGKRGVEGIVVSHADHDHFNGVFELLESLTVGKLIISQPFLDFDQYTIRDLCEVASSHRVPIEIVAGNDELKIGEHTLYVLHPASQFRSQHDNANSIVLRIEFAGRSLLLTGDLERDGIPELVQRSIEPVDVMLAPHHGSAKSNPPELYDWAQPAHIIISTGDADALPRLQADLQGRIDVKSTHDSGAIMVRISKDGVIEIDEYHSPSRR